MRWLACACLLYLCLVLRMPRADVRMIVRRCALVQAENILHPPQSYMLVEFSVAFRR